MKLDCKETHVTTVRAILEGEDVKRLVAAAVAKEACVNLAVYGNKADVRFERVEIGGCFSIRAIVELTTDHIAIARPPK